MKLPRMRFGVVLVACCLWSCLGNGKLVVVQNRAAVPSPNVDRLRAGVAQVDLTPPPGLPTYGFSSDGAARTEGYWLRLHGRIIVLESGTTRVALMQLDLGAASALLQRKIAQRIEPLGIAAPQLVMSTTHTHGGPSAIFADKFFNNVVGADSKFDEHLVDAMADALAQGVKDALGNMKDARAAWGQAQVPVGISSNRSMPAWLNNFVDGQVPGSEVDRTLTMLRIDVDEGNGKTRPLAAWSVFAVHGNSIGPVRAAEPKASLFHGDVHGLAARLTARRIETRTHVSDFLAATTTGAEGDVTPGPTPGGPQGLTLTMSVAEGIAATADRLHGTLDAAIAAPGADQVPIAVVYDETSLRGANTTQGRLCPNTVLGGPQMRGSEEGRGVPGWAAPILRTDEGLVDPPHGCTATRVYAIGKLQEIAIMPADFPEIGTFQLITFGEPSTGLALAAVPGEPTTEVGRLVMGAIARERWKGPVAVMGLTNAYLLYVTTGAEYLIQDYEGGGTIFGGHEGTFFAEEFGRLAARWRPKQVITVGFDLERAFRPGEQTDLIPTTKSPVCEPSKWKPGALEVTQKQVVFHWSGAEAGERCALAKVRIECGGQVLLGDGGFPQTDDGYTFEIRRDSGYGWSATWAPNGTSAGTCQVVVDAGTAQVRSKEFKLPEVK
jgi:neutral ceramidase